MDEKALAAHLAHADRLLTVARLQSAYFHDAGTPLMIILGHASMLASDPEGSAESKAAAKAILEAGRSLDGLLKRLTAGAQPDPPTPTAVVTSVLADVVAFLEPLGRRHGTGIRVDTATLEGDAASAEARMDALLLRQAVQNVVLNAVLASPRGADVVLRVSREGSRLVVEVQDRGPGIPPELADKVFEPFFTTRSACEGAGLGLFMVKTLVEQAGGDVTLAHPPEGGLIVRLSLPSASV